MVLPIYHPVQAADPGWVAWDIGGVRMEDMLTKLWPLSLQHSTQRAWEYSGMPF